MLEELAGFMRIELDGGAMDRMRAFCDAPALAQHFVGAPVHEGAFSNLGPKYDHPTFSPLVAPDEAHEVASRAIRAAAEPSTFTLEPQTPNLLPKPFDDFVLALDGVVCPSCNRQLTWDKLPATAFHPIRLELFHDPKLYPGEVVARVTCGGSLGDSSAGCLRSSEVRCPVKWANEAR